MSERTSPLQPGTSVNIKDGAGTSLVANQAGALKVDIAAQGVRLGMDIQSQVRALIDSKIVTSSATLASTGSTVDVSDFAYLTLCPQSSVQVEVQVQQSADGTNFDVVDSITVNGNVAARQPIPVVGTHARLVVGTGTGTCRIYLFGRTI